MHGGDLYVNKLLNKRNASQKHYNCRRLIVRKRTLKLRKLKQLLLGYCIMSQTGICLSLSRLSYTQFRENVLENWKPLLREYVVGKTAPISCNDGKIYLGRSD